MRVVRNLVLGFSVAVFLLVGLLFTLTTLHSVSSQKEKEGIQKNNIYKGRPFLGYMNIRDEYHDEKDVEKDKFECTGSCFCDEDNDDVRRIVSSSQVVIHNLKYFLVASSTIFAFKKAKEYFEDSCRQKFMKEGKCSGTVMSEVEECESVAEYLKNYEIEKEKKKNDLLKKELKDLRDFECSGACLPNTKIKEYTAKKMSKEYNCEKLKQDRLVRVSRKELKRHFEMSLSQNYRNRAMEKFLQYHFSNFCSRESMTNYDIPYFRKERGNRIGPFYRKKKISLCSGGNNGKNSKNINCTPFIRSPVKM